MVTKVKGSVLLRDYDTLADAVAAVAEFSIGDTLRVKEHSSGNAGEGVWDVVDATTVTENLYTIVAGDATRSLVLRVGKELNVRQIGAAGGEATNDTGPIKHAFAYSAANNVVAYIPIGTYLVDSMITLANGTQVRGEDKYTSVIKLSADTDGQTKMFFGDTLSNVSLQNFQANTDKASNLSARGVFTINFTTGGDRLVFKDIYIPGSTSSGFFIDNTSRVTIERCDIRKCENDPIRMGTCSQVKVMNNSITDHPDMPINTRGIQIGTSTDFIVSGNNVEGVDAASTMALDFGGSVRGTIVNNIIYNCRSIMDLEGGSTDITFSGNVCSSGSATRSNGIWGLENGGTCNRIAITGNTITGFLNGIYIEGGLRVTITGNTIAECDQSGIRILDGTTVVSNIINISGNTIYNCSLLTVSTYAAINVKATRGLITGNMINGTHSADIDTDVANTLVQVGANQSGTVDRGETFRSLTLSNAKIFETATTPEAFLVGNVGDICIRDAGSTSIIYVKHTGDATNTGWKTMTHSTGTTGGTASAGAGNQYVEITVGNTTYKVLHDGTV